MPDLSKLFRTTLALNPFLEVEQQTMAAAATTLNLNLDVEDLEDVDVVGDDDVDAAGEAGGSNGVEDVKLVENGEDEDDGQNQLG